MVQQDAARDLLSFSSNKLRRELSVVMVGDSDRLRAGEVVFAIGHPFGLNRR
ncbi:MAG: hypothetical protein WKF30_06550 [Pyrinomonadaceae bacterium]